MKSLHVPSFLIIYFVAAVTGLLPAHAALPNIILAMADDQGWGDMGYSGHPVIKTPNFDSMAASGLRFDRFYAAAPVCSPTRGSVMTGRHPNRFGCFKWGHTLRPQETTVAEALRSVGYRTGHFGKWHLGSVRRGSPVNPGESGFDEWFSAPNYFDNDAILSRNGIAEQTEGESSMVTVDAALAFIRESVAQDKGPFLAVVWFGSPHGPHLASDEFAEIYADQEKPFQHYNGEVSGMDAAFGKLRNSLGELGIRENTILWYCSDNGALKKVGSSGGHRGNKGQIYEGGLLVPSILEWPQRIAKPRVSKARCNTTDIYPTLLEIAGVTIEDQATLDGVSLVPLLDGSMVTRPVPMGFWDMPVGGVSTPSATWMAELLAAQQAGGDEGSPERLRLDAGELTTKYTKADMIGHSAWIDGDWKLHRIVDKNGDVSYELYDLDADREEARDLVAAEPERVKKMQKALERWQLSVIASLNGADY